jgi:hypothetical protein
MRPLGFDLSRFASAPCASANPGRTLPMPSLVFALILALLACHYAQEAACGHQNRRACASMISAALAYAAYALKVALGG